MFESNGVGVAVDEEILFLAGAGDAALITPETTEPSSESAFELKVAAL